MSSLYQPPEIRPIVERQPRRTFHVLTTSGVQLQTQCVGYVQMLMREGETKLVVQD